MLSIPNGYKTPEVSTGSSKQDDPQGIKKDIDA
jgi:hypothetical protein